MCILYTHVYIQLCLYCILLVYIVYLYYILYDSCYKYILNYFYIIVLYLLSSHTYLLYKTNIVLNCILTVVTNTYNTLLFRVQ